MVKVHLANSQQYYSVQSLTGYPDGTSLVITNLTTDPLFVSQSPDQPLNDDTSFPVYDSKTVIINSGDVPIWLRGSTGPVIVQDFNSVILPSDAINPRILLGLEAITVQSFPEANCKNGTQYEVTTFEPNFVAGQTRDFVVVTGTKPVLIKNREFFFTGSRLTVSIYRSPTYTGGTVVPYYNFSDINPVAGESTIIGAPVVTFAGTRISPEFNLIGSIPQGGQAVVASSAENSVSGLERVLAPNTTYLFRTVNSGTTCILSTIATWYEGFLSSTAF